MPLVTAIRHGSVSRDPRNVWMEVLEKTVASERDGSGVHNAEMPDLDQY